MATLKTVRQAAREPDCPYTEFRLRQMIAQNQCPGVRVGNRFMVNLDALIEQVNTASVAQIAKEEQVVKEERDQPMTDNLPTVTRENYFSPEINMAYMSATQFKRFRSCEAAALAELHGEYTPATSQAFLVGGYIDAYFAGESALYAAQHPEMFKRDGQLKAEFVHAQDVIERMKSDDLYSLLMSGEKQVIRTGKIAGVPFKIKMDSLLSADQCAAIAKDYQNTQAALGFCDGAIVDQKAMKDLASVYDAEEHASVSFVEAYGYDIQGAIYQAVEGHQLPFILAVGTKENEPDLAALYISDEDLAAKLAEVEDNAPRYQAIKKGREKPRRCERCDYCKMTRRLDRIVNYKDMEALWES